MKLQEENDAFWRRTQEIHTTMDIESMTDKDEGFDSLATKLTSLLSTHFGRGHHKDFIAKGLCAVIGDNFMEGSCLKYMCAKINSPYTTEGILKQMDLAGGVLNLGGYNGLRKIEILENFRNKNWTLPPVGFLKQEIKMVNDIAQKQIPFETFLDNDTDTVKFDYTKLLWYVLKAF